MLAGWYSKNVPVSRGAGLVKPYSRAATELDMPGHRPLGVQALRPVPLMAKTRRWRPGASGSSQPTVTTRPG
jgi:hypothetical protein